MLCLLMVQFDETDGRKTRMVTLWIQYGIIQLHCLLLKDNIIMRVRTGIIHHLDYKISHVLLIG